MTEISDRFRRVADDFTRRALAVPQGAWDNPAPCEGWVARDIVEHMIDWMPAVVVEPAGLPRPQLPPVAIDPATAWVAFTRAIHDPRVRKPAGPDDLRAGGRLLHHRRRAHAHVGSATGQDETLDADEVHRLYEGMLPFDAMLRSSGHYGPKVEVPDDADEQTRLIAFTGRTPR